MKCPPKRGAEGMMDFDCSRSAAAAMGIMDFD
jgi:hypothetical protein